MKKPKIIAFSADFEQGRPENYYSKYEFLAIRQNYFTSIEKYAEKYNFICLVLTHNTKQVKHYANLIDGLVIIGGESDFPPELYGQERHHRTTVNQTRVNFERAMLDEFLPTEKPFLGICAGMQMLAGHFGCSMYQHLPDQWKTNIKHQQGICAYQHSHKINVLQGTKLSKILEDLPQSFMVNSAHHQAVSKLQNKISVSATAEDGLIEAIEITDHNFCIGVQWHPEFEVCAQDRALLERFCQTVCL